MILPENANLATHGQIGKEFIYWTIAGQQFKRPYKIPDDPKTFDQRTQRNKFYVATQIWNKLTTEQKKEWEEKVKKTQYIITGYNYFIREKIKEITQMVKKVTHGTALLGDGVTVIPIAAIQLDKTVLHYNCFFAAIDGPPVTGAGITHAYFSDSTHISALSLAAPMTGPLTLYYSIVEYV